MMFAAVVNIDQTFAQLQISLLILLNVTYIFLFIMGLNMFQVFANMDETISDNNIFKNIIENQNEAVIMVSGGNKIEYVNNKFLTEFQNEIMAIYQDKYGGDGQQGNEMMNYGSSARKVTNFIKSLKMAFKRQQEDDKLCLDSDFLKTNIISQPGLDENEDRESC